MPHVCHNCGGTIQSKPHRIGSDTEGQPLYRHPKKCKPKRLPKQQQRSNGLSRVEGKIITFTKKPLKQKYQASEIRIRAAAQLAIKNGFDYILLSGETLNLNSLVQ